MKTRFISGDLAASLDDATDCITHTVCRIALVAGKRSQEAGKGVAA